MQDIFSKKSGKIMSLCLLSYCEMPHRCKIALTPWEEVTWIFVMDSVAFTARLEECILSDTNSW